MDAPLWVLKVFDIKNQFGEPHFTNTIFRADTLVRFAAGSPENGLFCQNGPIFGLFLPPKVLFHTWNMHV